jgi:hypothetical protein
VGEGDITAGIAGTQFRATGSLETRQLKIEVVWDVGSFYGRFEVPFRVKQFE